MSELLIIFLVALLLFGAKRLPEIARGLGQGIREFKKASHEISRELQIEEPPRTAAPRQGPAVSRPAEPVAVPPSESMPSGN